MRKMRKPEVFGIPASRLPADLYVLSRWPLPPSPLAQPPMKRHSPARHAKMACWPLVLLLLLPLGPGPLYLSAPRLMKVRLRSRPGAWDSLVPRSAALTLDADITFPKPFVVNLRG